MAKTESQSIRDKNKGMSKARASAAVAVAAVMPTREIKRLKEPKKEK